MKTRAKRIAAIFMAAVMTAALAVPAFADDPTVEDPKGSAEGQSFNSMTFEKEYVTDEQTYLPDETLTFTVTPDDPSGEEKVGNPATLVRKGITGTVTASTVSTTEDTATVKGGKSYYPTFTFNFPANTEPGIYKYKVVESSNKNYTDMKYAADQYLYVYVRRNASNAIEVYGAALQESTGVNGAKSGKFTNEFKNNGHEEQNEFKDLTIAKSVTGTMGDKTKEFHFKVKVDSFSGRTTYAAFKSTDSNTEIKLTNGKEYEFVLANGQSLKIENLSALDKYTIEETDHDTDGYTTTYSCGDAPSTEPMGDADVTVTVTNKRDAVNPTGIIMNYGPYIAMIVAAAVLAFVFLRRKEEI